MISKFVHHVWKVMILRLQIYIVKFVMNIIAMSAQIFIKKIRITKDHELSSVNFDNMNLSSNPIYN